MNRIIALFYRFQARSEFVFTKIYKSVIYAALPRNADIEWSLALNHTSTI
jgi:hypothetical protein